MSVNNTHSGPVPPPRSRPPLRTAGVLILLLGLAAAGTVYCTGAPPDDGSDDPATAPASKTELRNIEMNFGKMGVMMTGLLHNLKYPGTQALIIVLVTGLAASGCFYVARLQERAGQSDEPGS
jgi:hypothetical protein